MTSGAEMYATLEVTRHLENGKKEVTVTPLFQGMALDISPEGETLYVSEPVYLSACQVVAARVTLTKKAK